MIRLRDSMTLAMTKLRTRKVRLIVTVVISGLLFCGLATASLIARGAFHSIDSFNNEGFGKRYVVLGYYQPAYPDTTNTKLIDRAVAIQKDLIARKKVAAKTLGIDYDSANEPSPVTEYDSPTGKQRNLDFNNESAQKAIEESVVKTTITAADMTKAAMDDHSIATYESHVYGFSGAGTLQVLKEGKEDFATSSNMKQVNGPPTGTDSFTGSWSLMSGELLKPFMLKDTSLDDKGDGTIPIIVPVNAAEQLLGLKTLPESAKPAEKLARMKKLRSEAPKLTFEVCYRNETSAGLISTAVSTAQELEQNKKNKEYVKPDFILGLPNQACGPVSAVRDIRAAADKTLASKQEQFEQMFGKEPATEQKLKFRVVGMSPDLDYSAAFGVAQIVRSLVTSSLGSGWFTPLEYQAKVPLLAALFKDEITGFGPPPTYYAEFPTANDARHFMDSKSCEPDFGNITKMEASVSSAATPFDPFAKCKEEGKPFTLSPYGSNSLALESAKRGFGKIFGIAALVAAVIAAIIMMGTVGRMIADSRRETAVFRAIGAKKIDIAQVYVLYTILLAILICIFSILVGMVIASVVNGKYSEQATIQSLVAYNAQDLDRKFILFNFYLYDIARLVGLVLVASVISSILPLIRNLRRNPIRDMRDDT